MNTIKIKFIDWWKCDIKETFIYKFLDNNFKIELSDNPEFIICSDFGEEYRYYNQIKIFYTAENIVPNFNLYDYAIGFDYLNFKDRYIRYPSCIANEIFLNNSFYRNIDDNLFNRKFCSFVVSNSGLSDVFRGKFFDILNNYSKIDSGGAYKNNIGYRVDNKLEFIKKYKFNLAMENSMNDGYTTEKMIDSFRSCSIPIYWGYGKDEFINEKSFININNFSNINDCILYIDEVNKNKNTYIKMLEEEPLNLRIINLYLNNLKDFFHNIFTHKEKKLKYSGRRHLKYGIIC